ncbi:CBS domain-containing protein [Acidocella sp.]|uniref:CBS domain-containing protein n=1 Tax=Acidocella sp. TaxID=50710 RepID=UPI00262FC47B|nr:CBS domain-containing protein [Acidocella sp.]MDD2796004.1 CBS domain-containing protein [Acidocella sp.]
MILQAILANKPAGYIAVPQEMRVSAVIAVLAEKHIGAVLVVGPQDDLVGILSERDVVRSLSVRAAATLYLTAADLMTPNPATASRATTVEEAMELMTNGRFRHLPVLEDGRLIGLVSIGDVVKARIDHQKYEVETLRTYVAGGV